MAEWTRGRAAAIDHPTPVPMTPNPPDYEQHFDVRGASYDDAMVRWPHARTEEFAFVLRLAGLTDPLALPTPCRVLDVPAGGGYLADHMPQGIDYLALECAASFADRCRQRGLAVVEADLRGADLPDRSFDVVVSVAGLHHEPDLAATLAAWRPLLRPGGRLVIADVARGSAVATFLDGYVGSHNALGHEGAFFGPDLGEVVVEAGYRDVVVVDDAYHWWFDDHEALGRYCAGLFGLRDQSWQEVADAARRGPGVDVDPDGRVGLRWGLRAAVATAPTGASPPGR